MKEFLQKNKEKLFVLLLLLLAAFLRLYRIADYITFLGDEGRDALVVYNILHGKLTLLGPTSSVGGFFLGPIYYYFMAPFLWLSHYNPVGPAIMVALFGVATVFVIYKVGKKAFGEKAGYIAALLYAISPVVIAYSRSSWNPNLMPFFTLSTLYILYKAVNKNSIKLFLLSGFLYGIAMQLHYIEVFVGVIIIVYVFLIQLLKGKAHAFSIHFLRNILKECSLIFVGFLAGFSPFLAFEVRHGFPNLQSIFNFVFYSKDTGADIQLFSVIGNVFFRLFGRLVTKFPPPEHIPQQNPIMDINFFVNIVRVHVDVWYWFTLLIAFASTGYFIFITYSAWKKKQKNFPLLVLLGVWFTIGVLLFGFYKKPIYDYYFEFMFPLSFLLVGNLLQNTTKRILVTLLTTYTATILFIYNPFPPISFLHIAQKAILYWIALYLPLIALLFFLFKNWKKEKLFLLKTTVSCVVLYLLVVINATGIPFLAQANRQLAQFESIARFVYEKTGGKPFNFALITGGNSDHAYRYFFKLWGHDPITIQNEAIDPKRESTTEQLFVVCESLPCFPLGASLWEVAGFGRAEIEEKWNISVVEVYKMSHYRGPK